MIHPAALPMWQLVKEKAQVRAALAGQQAVASCRAHHYFINQRLAKAA